MKRRSFRRLRSELDRASKAFSGLPKPRIPPQAPAGQPPAGRKESKAIPSEHHHHVYVVLLDSMVRKFRNVQRDNPGLNPAKSCIYVGMTGLNPEERFENHKKGLKSARVVRDYGLGLMPELYEHLNPMPYEAAVQMEMDLADDLRRQGYTVTGGH